MDWGWDILSVIEKLEEIIALSVDGEIPSHIGSWATHATDIFKRFSEMIESDENGGSKYQWRTLRRIEHIADKWLL